MTMTLMTPPSLIVSESAKKWFIIIYNIYIIYNNGSTNYPPPENTNDPSVIGVIVIVSGVGYEICLQIKALHPPLPQSPPQLLPPVDHPFSDRMRPLQEWEICPLSNGKICSLPREKFFSHQRKNSRCPARWALPSPSPACALQTHAPVPRHTATHARRRVM